MLSLQEKEQKVVAQLVADMKAGKVHTLIMNGVNPAYTLANSKDFCCSFKIS